jgi:hypothetical protein
VGFLPETAGVVPEGGKLVSRPRQEGGDAHEAVGFARRALGSIGASATVHREEIVGVRRGSDCMARSSV